MTNPVRCPMMVGVVLAATACGGGGGGDPIFRPHADSVPLAQPITTLQKSGFQKTFSVTGTLYPGGQPLPVTGSLQFSVSAHDTATTFNGQAALGSVTTVTGTLDASGQSIPVTITRQGFVTNNHVPLGSQTSGQYCVVTSWTPLPATISFPDSVPYSKSACYSDSTMATSIGTYSVQYYSDIGLDSSSSNLLIKQIEDLRYPAGQQSAISYVELDYLIDTSGNLIIRSFDLSATVDGIAASLRSR